MDANQSDDMNELERRLSAWKPAADGLNADAMLFAAGRAAARVGMGRFVWPALACLMAVLTVFLGVWLKSERDEKHLLAQQIRQHAAAVAPLPELAPALNPTGPPASDEPSPESYFVGKRALEHGLEAWPPRLIARADPAAPPAAEAYVLRAGQWDELLNH